jgi:signal transduction histidine kinase
MGVRSRSIRSKIFTLLALPMVVLIGLWVFAANITISDGLSYFKADTEFKQLNLPPSTMMFLLDVERQLSTTVVGAAGRGDRTELDTARKQTDAALSDMRTKFNSSDAKRWGSASHRKRALELLGQTDRLTEIRAKVDAGSRDPLPTYNAYNSLIDLYLGYFEFAPNTLNASVYKSGRDLVSLNHARELISRENALISGALAARRFTGEERKLFSQLVTNERYMYSISLPAMDPGPKAELEQFLATPVVAQVRAMEDQILNSPRSSTVPVNAQAWRTAVSDLSQAQGGLSLKLGAEITKRTQALAGGILTRLAIAGGAGLLAIIILIIMSVRIGRRVAGELVSLQRSVLQLAHESLPRVVERLGRGDEVDVASETRPPDPSSTTEITEVASAFSAMQHTAIQAAVGQANLRKGFAEVFLNIARRNQSLLHRQLTLLDAMEYKASAPDTLKDLYQLDHLTTRMRRHAEGLIIMSGALPGRGWHRPVAATDVVRSAVAEVEDYTRVKVSAMPGVAIAGTAVTDVIHLLAELVENATAFSPPSSHVQVRGEIVGKGYVIEVVDRGLGLSMEQMAGLNARLAAPPEFDKAETDRLGLFVVARLALRHGIKVRLDPSSYGGTTAIVLLPHDLVTHDDAGEDRMIEGEGPVRTPAHARQAAAEPAPRPMISAQPVQRTQPVPRPQPVQRAEQPLRSQSIQRAQSGRLELLAPTPAPAPASWPAADDDDDLTEEGLPRRTRQSNLAPQLREQARAGAEPLEDEEIGRSPEEARSLMQTMQRGWQRGRSGSEDQYEG